MIRPITKMANKKYKKPNSFTWKLFFLPIIYYMKIVSNKKEIDPKDNTVIPTKNNFD